MRTANKYLTATEMVREALEKARRYADTLHKMGRDDEIVEAGGWFLL